jgi:hypothetical protein
MSRRCFEYAAFGIFDWQRNSATERHAPAVHPERKVAVNELLFDFLVT